jgi:accessory colonization factor AcfC
MPQIRKLFTAAALFAALGASQALAEVTVLGWPGGPEETALRAAAETYNATAADADKVKLGPKSAVIVSTEVSLKFKWTGNHKTSELAICPATET